jgi:hypothetical protein
VPLGEEREDLCRQRVPSKDLDGVIRLGDFNLDENLTPPRGKLVSVEKRS